MCCSLIYKVIEVFPDIVKERLSEMRVIDLEVENAFDRLKDAEREFFKHCPMMDDETRQREYKNKISKVYDQCVEKIDEKIHSSSQLLDMVERYIYKQETEVSKFKLELEADNGGVTEILERQVAEEAEKQQQLLRHQRIEKKRHHNRLSTNGSHSSASPLVANSVVEENGVGGSVVKRVKSNHDIASSNDLSRVSGVGEPLPVLTLDRVDSLVATPPPYLSQLPTAAATAVALTPPVASSQGAFTNHISALPPHQLTAAASSSSSLHPAPATSQHHFTNLAHTATHAPAGTAATTATPNTLPPPQSLQPLLNGGVPVGGAALPRSSSEGADLSSVGSGPLQLGIDDACGGSMAVVALHRHIGAGNTAIAAAASQAIQATQQMPAGRRTASLKASYAAVAKGSAGLQHYLTGGSAGSAVPGAVGTGSGHHQPSSSGLPMSASGRTIKATAAAQAAAQAAAAGNRGKKLGTLSKSASSVNLSSMAGGSGSFPVKRCGLGSAAVGGPHSKGPSGGGKGPLAAFTGGLKFKSDAAAGGGASSEDGEAEFVSDDAYSDQADNQLYCKCRQVSYGDMIACDNPDCPIEWFHYPCVNLVSAPKGKWFCPDCIISMKRRGMKKL